MYYGDVQAYYDEKVDLGCHSAARFLRCSPASSVPPTRKLDSNRGAKPVPPRALVRSDSARHQKRSEWFVGAFRRKQSSRSGRYLVSPEISERLARHLVSPNTEGQDRFGHLERCDGGLQRQDF